MKASKKVDLATKYVAATDKAYAYLAWDSQCTFGTEKRKASYAIIDITDELNPVVLTWWGTSCYGPLTEFNASVATNWFSNDVGWFYYSFADPCEISFVGFGDDDLALSSLTGFGSVSGPTTFPGMIMMTGCLEDG
jgi:hypothetical protein